MLTVDKHLLMLNYKHQKETLSYFQNSNAYILQKQLIYLTEENTKLITVSSHTAKNGFDWLLEYTFLLPYTAQHLSRAHRSK